MKIEFAQPIQGTDRPFNPGRLFPKPKRY